MNELKDLFFILLICSPISSKADIYKYNVDPIKEVSIKYEYLDPKEYIHNYQYDNDEQQDSRSNYSEDLLDLLKDRIKKDLWNAPHTWQDPHRYLDLDFIQKQMSFNRDHDKWLEVQIFYQNDKVDYFKEWRLRNTQAYHIWDMLRDIKYFEKWNDIAHKRKKMKELRDKLGWDQYYSGQMPNSVPLEFFNEIR